MQTRLKHIVYAPKSCVFAKIFHIFKAQFTVGADSE